MKIKKSLLILFVFSLAFSLAAIFQISQTKAGVGNNTSGWPWGGSDDGNMTGAGVIPTGLGRISLNVTNCGSYNAVASRWESSGTNPNCPPIGTVMADYGLDIPSSDGDFVGPGWHAWSSNVGWISFNPTDLGGCPTAPCTARRVGNNLKGWARILSIRDAGANAGGWEGWIKLGTDGTEPPGTPSYGITLNADGTITKDPNTSYAWSKELGWIDFSKASMAVTVTNQLKICIDTCVSGSVPLVNASDNLFMFEGETRNLRACFNTSSACDLATGDVTNDPGTTWTEGGGSAVSLSGASPKILTADNIGTETVAASYPGANAQFTADVSPMLVCNGCEANTCVDSTCDNGCGNSTANGTKVCNNTGGSWKEVAP